ncbi:MAG: hypothetical protein KKE20_04090 [Nanoarchaeota archaeon]|nr:hypothetical protein [Nanoarchaeota archaeon]
MKKGDLSLNLIIIAAILMIIFIVLILIFTGRMSIFKGSIEDCLSVRGECVQNPATECTGDYKVINTKYSCDNDRDNKPNEGEKVDGVCCVSIA